MSTITVVKNNEVYKGFDIQSIRKCTPEVLGFRVCAELTADGDGTVVLKLIAESPLGNFSKEFKFSSDINFEFNPISGVKINVAIRKFKVTEQLITFDLTIKGCIKPPFIKEKCVEKTFPIELPMPGLAVKGMNELSSGDLALLLLAAQDEACNCN